MATTMVTVNVPDGVYEFEEFIMEWEGQSLSVVCPAGCGPGSEINLEVPTTSGAPPAQVEVVVPDGCYPGTEFTVEFDGQTFNVGVPEGVRPGMALLVDVPRQSATGPPAPKPARLQK